MKLLSILCVVVSLCASRVSAETIFGPSIKIGNGEGRVFVEKEAGRVDALGISLDDGALLGLPEETKEYILELPSALPPYNHVGINWQPKGHNPDALKVPHFDIHFYFVSEDKQHAISCRGADAEMCAKRTDDDFLPYGHFAGSQVPKMGAHWYDQSNAAFCGGQFTGTMVYGFYGGDMIFLEPMVAHELISSKNDFIAPIPQPLRHQNSGLYPVYYVVDFDQQLKRHRVYMAGFVPN